MKIAVIGATGFIGTQIVNELAGRNHEVLGISRTMQMQTEAINFIIKNVFDTNDLAASLNAIDVVVSAYNPGWYLMQICMMNLLKAHNPYNRQ